MKNVFIICCMLFMSCAAKKNIPSAQSDSLSMEKAGVANEDKTTGKCIESMIAKFKAEDVQNPPRKIYSYTYNGKLVYYVTPPCCDFFSDLYDDNCNLIAHPDGGITGKGDGRAKDFISARSNEKLVWEDERKYR